MNGLIRVTHPKIWPLFAAAFSFAALCLAWVSEAFWGLIPCPLCYTQRYIYWAGIAAGLAGYLATRIGEDKWARAANGVLFLIFLVGVYYASYHAGVEWEVFTPPGGCSGSGDGLVFDGGLDLDAQLKLTDCIAAPFRFLGLSMAGWNVLAYLTLTLGSLWAAFRGKS